MTWYYYNHGEPIHVPNGDPRFNRDGIFYVDPAPVSFRTPPFYNDPSFNGDGIFVDPAPVSFRSPPFYNDVYYRRSFRDQHPHFSHGGELIPASEQVHIRREDPYPYPYPTPTASWWLNRDYPHYGGYPVLVVERPHGNDEEDSNLEFYAPQLYSDSRERKVVDALRAFPGVANVVADQWEKKVVVVGNGLRGEHVLRRLRLVPHMERSVFWRDRRC